LYAISNRSCLGGRKGNGAAFSRNQSSTKPQSTVLLSNSLNDRRMAGGRRELLADYDATRRVVTQLALAKALVTYSSGPLEGCVGPEGMDAERDEPGADSFRHSSFPFDFPQQGSVRAPWAVLSRIGVLSQRATSTWSGPRGESHPVCGWAKGQGARKPAAVSRRAQHVW
jgi:hypothetical protein